MDTLFSIKYIIKMKRFVLFLSLALTLLFTACGGSKHDSNKFAGSFTDEFNNKFVLNEDYTGTIQFAGNDKVEQITWSDGTDHKRPYATIKWNGDPSYYFLRDGALYRYEKDMDEGRAAIKITYNE